MSIERFGLAPGLSVSRVITGLWQVADMERGGRALDTDERKKVLGHYPRWLKRLAEFATERAYPRETSCD